MTKLEQIYENISSRQYSSPPTTAALVDSSDPSSPQIEAAETAAQMDHTHSSFRLWLSSYPSPDFPSLLLRNGIKMTNEPPRGLKASLVRGYTSSKPLQESLSLLMSRSAAAQRLIYNLSLMHAVIEGRKGFGTLGWTISYAFTMADLSITTKQLMYYMTNSESTSSALLAVRTLAEQCNYGGRVTDERDKRILSAMLDEFCRTESTAKSGYQGLLSQPQCLKYELPEGTTLYRDVIIHI